MREFSVADLEIAGGMAVLLVVVFLLALWTQRRMGGPVGTPVMGHAKEWADVFDGRLATIEGWQKKSETWQSKADHDLNNIRAALPALPSKDAVHRLEVQVTQLAGKIETTDATVMSTSRAVDRIEAHLLSGIREK